MSSGSNNSSLSPFRWIETAVLYLLYSLVQAIIMVRDSVRGLVGNVVMLTVCLAVGVGVVMSAAIPVTAYFSGSTDTAVVHAEEMDSVLVADASSVAQDGQEETGLEHAKKHMDPAYVCPMHPEITSKNPNEKCPICGMDLVLVEAGGEGGIVQVSPETMNALGVRTDTVSRRNIFRKIDTVGYVANDENNIRSIALRTEAWIEKMHVKAAGDQVRKGDVLFEVYSPLLVNAQDEYVQALELNNQALVQASADRLRALGIASNQIKDLSQTRKVMEHVAIYAPQDGYVAELFVREGMQVAPANPVLNLIDLKTVWLLADVFERQADWVRVGQRARATLPFAPGKEWDGTVDYVYPAIDATTRSLKVRIKFDNVGLALKPNMYADVRILADAKKKVLTIPREAVIRTRDDERVIVALGDGRFIPMSVATGVETDDLVEITRGLQEGDQIVVSSQFMLDSEASIKAALMKMSR